MTPSDDRPADAAVAQLLGETARRAAAYIAQADDGRVTPAAEAIDALRTLDGPLPETGQAAITTLRTLDELGSPATVRSTGGSYFGYVLGGTLPAALAADWLVSAWDQSAASSDTSPAAAHLEAQAARWLLEVLDLPAAAAVGFATGASTGSLTALAAARRSRLIAGGWDVDDLGTAGAPPVHVVAPATVHVSVVKALRVLGIGRAQLHLHPVDPGSGRLRDLDRLPMPTRGILVLQAGDLTTGGFDDFAELIPRAHAAGTWVHVDGAFGLWARAARPLRGLTEGVELADSWTVDTHKWLNTPYDGAAVICRDPHALTGLLASDTPYVPADPTAQRNRTLEFSRRARGVPVWAALRTLGRDGIEALVLDGCRLARRLADGLTDAGFEVLNEVRLNQVVVADDDPALRDALIASGTTWCSPASVYGRPAMRFSVSSWRTADADVDAVVALLTRLRDRAARLPGTPARPGPPRSSRG